MEDKNVLNNEETENKQQLQEDELNKVNGGIIAIRRPSGDKQPGQSNDGNLV